MVKPGIHLDIPGGRTIDLRCLVSDYSGTLSRGGALSAGVAGRLRRLDALLDVWILTSDTYGTATREFRGLPVSLRILTASDHDRQKADFVRALGLPHVAALGNGRNDRLMLGSVREGGGLAIAVDNGEGCAVETLGAAELLVHGAAAALDLLLDPLRSIASLRV